MNVALTLCDSQITSTLTVSTMTTGRTVERVRRVYKHNEHCYQLSMLHNHNRLCAEDIFAGDCIGHWRMKILVEANARLRAMIAQNEDAGLVRTLR
jgi:hypothetical protein